MFVLPLDARVKQPLQSLNPLSVFTLIMGTNGHHLEQTHFVVLEDWLWVVALLFYEFLEFFAFLTFRIRFADADFPMIFKFLRLAHIPQPAITNLNYSSHSCSQLRIIVVFIETKCFFTQFCHQHRYVSVTSSSHLFQSLQTLCSCTRETVCHVGSIITLQEFELLSASVYDYYICPY